MMASTPTSRRRLRPTAAPMFVFAFVATIVLACLSQLGGAVANVVPSGLVITNAVNNIDLNNPSITRILISFSAKNTDAESPVSDLFLTVNASLASQISFLGVEQKTPDGSKVPLQVVEQPDLSSTSVSFFKAKLAAPLGPGESTNFYVKEVYASVVEPFPREQVQVKPQFLKYQGNLYMFSPYPIEVLKTNVKFRTSGLQSATQQDSKTADRLTYGPFSDSPALAFSPLYVHWMDNTPLLVAKSHEGNFELSHWGGNLWVEEHYELHHQGAKLKGQFSRVDYQFTQNSHHTTNVLKELKLTLPARASEVYFKDAIGNVSTTHFRKERTKSLLEAKPRYPLYGGWKYTWFHGYYVPLADYVKFDKTNQNYVFMVSFVGALTEVPAEKSNLKIVLPDGATDVSVHAPFAVDKQDITTSYTYFDVIGRPTILLEKKVVTGEHASPIYITYKLSSFALFRKPIAVTLVIFGFFLVSMVYARLDLSITTDQTVERDTLLRTHRATISEVNRTAKSLFQQIDAAFEEFKGKRETAKFNTRRSELEDALSAQLHRITDIEKAFSDSWASAGGAMSEQIKEQHASESHFVKGLKEFSKLLRSRIAKLKSMQNDVVTFLAESDKGEVDEKKKKQLNVLLDKVEGEIAEIDRQTVKVVAELQS